jgi:protein-tyrosine phosphatase
VAGLVLQLGDGQLLQGGADDADEAIAAPFLVDYLVLAARGHQPLVPPGLEGCRLELEDALPRSAEQGRRVLAGAAEVAREVARRVRRGQRVLVTCAAGLNRSGLVSGLALRRLGVDGPEAVELVRRARGPRALGNPAFAAMVLA